MKTYIEGKTHEELYRDEELLGQCGVCGALYGMSREEAEEKGTLFVRDTGGVYVILCANCENMMYVATPLNREYTRLRALADRSEVPGYSTLRMETEFWKHVDTREATEIQPHPRYRVRFQRDTTVQTMRVERPDLPAHFGTVVITKGQEFLVRDIIEAKDEHPRGRVDIYLCTIPPWKMKLADVPEDTFTSESFQTFFS